MADPVITSTVSVGDRLPEHVQGPVSRATLALFAGASRDHVLLHIDSDYAKQAGMDDVFVHGMLGMAYLGQMLTHWRPQSQLRNWSVRFTAITPLHATLRCRGEITELFEDAGETRARITIGVWTDADIQTLDGEAIVAIS